MTRVIADLIDGEVRLSTQGDSVRRLFKVEELTGAASGRLAQAVRASGIPVIGAAHPVLPGVLATDVRASATNDPKVAIVEVIYSVPATSTTGVTGGTSVSIVADLYTEETTSDVNGQRIITTYFSTSATGSGSFSSTIDEQAHRIEVQRPTFSVQYSRIEASPPLNLARAYAGKVNAGAFLSEPADRWLCNIDSTQENANQHRVRYTFTLNQGGWQAVIEHNSAGIIPADATSSNGVRTAQVYRRANFSALRLPAI